MLAIYCYAFSMSGIILPAPVVRFMDLLESSLKFNSEALGNSRILANKLSRKVLLTVMAVEKFHSKPNFAYYFSYGPNSYTEDSHYYSALM